MLSLYTSSELQKLHLLAVKLVRWSYFDVSVICFRKKEISIPKLGRSGMEFLNP